MSVLCITQHRAHLTAKQNAGVAFLKKEKKEKSDAGGAGHIQDSELFLLF